MKLFYRNQGYFNEKYSFFAQKRGKYISVRFELISSKQVFLTWKANNEALLVINKNDHSELSS